MSSRARLLAVVVLLLLASSARAGWADAVNVDGWSAFARFWSSAIRPDVSAEFLRLTWDATVETLALALLGSFVAVVLGVVGALVLAQRLVGAGWFHRVGAGAAALPRAVHEILVALLLVQVFGFEPLVAVLAIGLPFGAVTAKVFADAIDDADRSGFDSLRAMGSSRFEAVLYGIGPGVRAEFVAYAFYRLECAIRSAAVLGIVGVGGLGFQLDLSFESLRYREIWSLIFALVVLSGVADALSTLVRRGRWRPRLRSVVLGATATVGWSLWSLGVDVSSLWSSRIRARLVDLVTDLVPPRLGPGGWSELWSATVDTMALATLSLAIAATLGLLGAIAVREPPPHSTRHGLVATLRRWAGKTVLLLARAVPAPVWAFLFVLVLFPGLWPGAVALGVYNAGVLGRLYAEAIETQPTDAERAAALAGATASTRWAYGVLPQAMPRLVSLSAYRGEVIVRETIVIGVVGAGGLGQLLRDHLAARDFAAVTTVVVVFVLLAVAADWVGAMLRARLGR